MTRIGIILIFVIMRHTTLFFLLLLAMYQMTAQGDCGISGILSIQDPAACGCGSSCSPMYCTPVASGNCNRQLISVFVEIGSCQNGTVIAETVNCNGTSSGLDYGDFCQVGTTRINGNNNQLIYIEECHATGPGQTLPVAITLSADRKDEIIEYRVNCIEHNLGCPGGYPPCSGFLDLQVTEWSIEAGANVTLKWTTTGSPYVIEYKILRSCDLKHWTLVNTVPNSPKILNYKSVDHSPLMGSNYYQLIEIHTDKTTEESPILHFERHSVHNLSRAEAWMIAGILHVSFENQKAHEYNYHLIDINGRQLKTGKKSAIRGSNLWQIYLSTLPSGTYTLIIQEKNEVINLPVFIP